MGTLTPAELEAVQSDVWEMIGWWRNRRLKQVHARTPRDTAPQTDHIERRYIERIREEAEAEGVSIREVVNRAFRAYCQRP
jgi:ribosome-binding protein aMBF1 (putative translation factor)